MDRIDSKQQEADAHRFNEKYAVAALATEIQRQGSSLMTRLEAIERARYIIRAGRAAR